MNQSSTDTGTTSSILKLSPVLRKLIIASALTLGLLSIAARISFIASPRGAATDFSQDYLSAKAWSHGLDPYTDTGVLVDKYFGSRSGYYDLLPPSQRNPHPPLFIALNSMFSGFSFRTARVLWLILSALLISAAAGWFVDQLGASRWIVFAAAAGVLALPVVQTELIYGQSNGILLLLLVIAWWGLQRGKQATAGLALGIASALKLFPALFLVVLLVRREKRAALWQLGSGLVATAIGTGLMGAHVTWEFFTKVSTINLRYWRSAPMNLSLVSVPFRWLTHSPWERGGVSQPALASAIALAVIVLCFAGLVASARRGSAGGLWEAVPWVLLMTPIVWETYLLLTLPLLVLILSGAVSSGEKRVPVLVLVGMALLVIGLPPGLPSPMRASVVDQVMGFQLPMYGLLIVALNVAKGRIDVPVLPFGSRRTAER